MYQNNIILHERTCSNAESKFESILNREETNSYYGGKKSRCHNEILKIITRVVKNYATMYVHTANFADPSRFSSTLDW